MSPRRSSIPFATRLVPVFVFFVVICSLSCGGGRRPGSDPVDSGDSETETEPLIDGEIPGWEMSWVVQAGGSDVLTGGWTSGDRGDGAAALPDGSSFITGNFTDNAVFGRDNPNETVLVNGGAQFDGFVARYAPNGELDWARRFGGDMVSQGIDVVLLDDGGGLAAGRIQGENTFFEGAEGETIVTSPGGTKFGYFAARFSTDGNLLWVTVGGHPDGESAIEGITPLDDDTAFVTGHFAEGLIVNPGGAQEEVLDGYGYHDCFAARLSMEDGTVEWARAMGGSGGDYGFNVAALADDAIMVLGQFEGAAIFGEGQPNEMTLKPSQASRGLFLAKYDFDGALIWAREVGVHGGFEWACGSAMAVSEDRRSVFVASAFYGDLILAEGTKKETTICSAPDGNDIFVAKYDLLGRMEWAKQARWVDEGTGDALLGGIDVTPSGRIVICGSHEGAMLFGEGETNETTLPRPVPGWKDLFIALYEPDGTLEWATSLGGTFDFDFALSTDTLGDRTIFVTGVFGDEMVFGTCTEDAVLLEANGSNDIFLMRLDETEPPT